MVASLGTDGQLFEKDFLQPLEEVWPAEKALVRFDRALLIVGHMPFMSRLCSLLLTGSPDAETVVFTTSSMACLDSTDSWKLLWKASPTDIGDAPG